LATLPLAATAYKDAASSKLLHIVNTDSWKAVCGDVRPESILHDLSVARGPEAATCKKCRTWWERVIGPLKK